MKIKVRKSIQEYLLEYLTRFKGDCDNPNSHACFTTSYMLEYLTRFKGDYLTTISEIHFIGEMIYRGFYFGR